VANIGELSIQFSQTAEMPGTLRNRICWAAGLAPDLVRSMQG
jgi:hypothetical protein